MKAPLTGEGCKTLAFYSIASCIIMAVVLTILSIWEITSSETGYRLMYSLFTILGGILIFTVVNVLFILSEDEQEDEKVATQSTIGRALKKAKLGDGAKS